MIWYIIIFLVLAIAFLTLTIAPYQIFFPVDDTGKIPRKKESTFKQYTEEEFQKFLEEIRSTQRVG